MRRLILSLAPAAALLLLQDTAGAISPREIALDLVRQGVGLLREGNCTAALERLARAKSIFPASYKVDVNLGTALECLGRLAEALDHFEAFLDRAHPEADGRLMERVRQKASGLKKRVASLTVRCHQPEAVVAIDGVEVGRTPLARPLHVQPGRRLLSVTHGTGSFSTTLPLAAGEEREVTAVWSAPLPHRATSHPAVSARHPAVSAATMVAPTGRRSTPIHKRWWFWTAIGVAVVGATAGVLATQVGGSDRMPRGEIHISLQ